MSITLTASFVDEFLYLTGGAVKTYLALQALKRSKPHPTQTDIASYMNASKRSVTTYLQELERGGYIQKRKIGAGCKTDYVLLNEPKYAEK